jgi:peptidoglycan-associated lipoprotein
MHKKLWLCLALLLVIPGLLFTTSCAKKTVKSEPATKEDAAKKAEVEAARQAELERQRKLQEERLKAERVKSGGGGGAGRAQFEKENIYFEFDRSNLKMDAQDVLKQKAAFLKANPNSNAIIQGHCDERGTNEYNLALGDRRANSAKKFLENLGIAGSRIKTVSFGEERPLNTGKGDAAWAKNRNCQFRLQ